MTTEPWRDSTAEWLTPTEYDVQQKYFTKQRFPGTCTWVLASQEYQEWLHGCNHTLFCLGDPGVGKTIIASTIVQNLQTDSEQNKDGNAKNTIGVAYIYFDPLRAGEQHLRNLIFAVLRQLVHGLSSLPGALNNMYFHCPSHPTYETPSLQDIVEVLHGVVKQYTQVFVILNALDGCLASHRAGFLRETSTLQSRYGVKVFATAEVAVPEFDALFDASLRLRIRASDEDLRCYATGGMLCLLPFMRAQANVQDELVTRVVASADGSFLLAKLHLDSLQYAATQISPQPEPLQSIVARLPSGPGAYDKAYNAAVGRIIRQDGERAELAQRVLSWLTVAPCQLTLSQLQDALAIEPRISRINSVSHDGERANAEELVAACCGLVRVYGESDIVQLIHRTARKHLAQNPTPWLSSAEAEVGAFCVAYLSQAKFEVGSCKTKSELEERLRSSPLYEYAARNWGRHTSRMRLCLPLESTNFLASQPKVEAACQAAMVVCRYPTTPLDCESFAKNLSSMHVAAYAGAENIIVASLTTCSPADLVNLQDSHGQTPFSWASQRGHDAIVEALLAEPHARVDVRNNEGRTPLSLAAEHGHAGVAKKLLDHGANANLKDLDGMIPLWHAARTGCVVLVQLLLAATKPSYLNLSLPPKSDSDHNKLTAFFVAVWNGHAEVVKLLLDQERVDYSTRFHGGKWRGLWSVLGFVVCHGYDEMGEHILRKIGIPPWPLSIESGEDLLHMAANNGSVRIAKLLLSDHVVDPNCRRDKGSVGEWATPLMSACAGPRGCDGVVKLLLETKGIRPELKNKKGQTALSIAAAAGNDAAVRTLLEKPDIDPDCRDNKGRTPLSLAARGLHEAVVQRLLQVRGVNPESRDCRAQTALWHALNSRKESEAVVRQLLTTGRVNPNDRLPDGRTPLHRTVGWLYEDAALVRVFLSYPETDPDARSDDGFTPVLLAAKDRNWIAVRLLLKTRRVDFNQQIPDRFANSGSTILGMAAEVTSPPESAEKTAEIVRLLLSKSGIQINIQNFLGCTPLMEAAFWGNLSIVKQLLAAPCAALNMRNDEGRTALSEAARHGNVEIVKLFLGFKGVEIESRDVRGQTPLSLAAAGACPGVVAQLLAVDGVDPDSRDLTGRTPLSWAMPNKSIDYSKVDERKEVVRLLLQCDGVDPNSEDDEGWTPLGRALEGHRADEILELLLLRRDLNLRHRDKKGRTPLSMAMGKGDVPTKLIQATLNLSADDENGNEHDGEERQVTPDASTSSTDDFITAQDVSRPMKQQNTKRLGHMWMNPIRDEFQREVQIKLESQPKLEGEILPEISRLCVRCQAIDLIDAFSRRPTKSSGRVVAYLGRLDETLETDICNLCKLIHAVRPQSAAENSDKDYQLRAFSSTNIWLCENAAECHEIFMTGWIDTVFLAVVPANFDKWDYPTIIPTEKAAPCSKVLSSGFISRVGSNCSYRLRALSVHRISSNNIDYGVVRGWINNCVKHHSQLGHCHLLSHHTIPHFCLIDCNSRMIVSPKSPVSFVALSYVWGVIPSIDRTDPKNATSLDDNQVEPVVEDAIRAILNLGYTHLWVDRHCIVQDDEKIKDVQLRHMSLVYQTAEVTLVAAAGEDSSFGLPGVGLRARKPQASAEVQGHMLTVIPPDPSRLVKSSKWATRRWTYQEGLFSRRRLFFTEHEVSYECAELLCREAVALPPHILKQAPDFSQRLQVSSWLFPREPLAAFNQNTKTLYHQLSEYTARHLSLESDALNAMLGIFQACGNLKERPIHHLCGIPIQPSSEIQSWDYKDSLAWFANGLGWRLLRPAHRRVNFPSWSWTGWKGIVEPPIPYEYFYKMEFGLNAQDSDCGDLMFAFPDGDNVSSDIYAEKEPWLEVSILEHDKPPLQWPEYMALTRAEKNSRFYKYHVLQLKAFVVQVEVREGSKNEGEISWRATVCIGDEVMGGPFYLTSDDSGLHRRFRGESWPGVVLGTDVSSDKRLHIYLLVLEEKRRSATLSRWERIGLAKVSWYNSTLSKDLFERKMFELQ